MKKYQVIKKCMALFICMMLMFSVCAVCASAADIYKRPQKHIFLVMDDSGSMEADEREYDSNYALQVMVAMMDKTDTMTVYFLNDQSALSGSVDLKNKSDSMLENIKVKYPKSSGGTPYDVVTQAKKDLRKAVAADDDSEYWLIVITDGAFTSPSMNYEEDIVNFAKGVNAKGKEEHLKNGKLPNVMCVSINCYSFVSEQNYKNLNNLHVIENMDAIPAMTAAAQAISGRVEIKDVTYSSDGKSLSFKIPYPAKNIIIFTQNTETKTVSYTSNDELDISENYHVARPVPSQSLQNPSTVSFITEKNGKSIKAGYVSFEMSKKIAPENTVVLIEPSIGLRAEFYNQDGDKCDPTDLKIGESAEVRYSLWDPDSNTVILDSMMNGNIDYTVSINDEVKPENTQKSDPANGVHVVDFVVSDSTLELDVTAKFPDLFVLNVEKRYTGITQHILPDLTLSNGGNFSADINSLDDNSFVTATPSYNGRILTEGEMRGATLSIKGENFFTSRFKIVKDEAAGEFRIFPKGGLFKVITPVNSEVDVIFVSERGEQVTAKLAVELTGERNWVPFLIALLIIAALIYLIIVYSIKPKFPLDLMLFSYKVTDPKKPVDIKHNQNKPKTLFTPGVLDLWSLLPWIHPVKIRLSAVSGSYGNMKLVAMGNGNALVTGVSKLQTPKKDDGIPVKKSKKKADPEYWIINEMQDLKSKLGFATDDGLKGGNSVPVKIIKKYGDVLILKDGKFMRQNARSTGSPKKQLRYIRRKNYNKQTRIK